MYLFLYLFTLYYRLSFTTFWFPLRYFIYTTYNVTPYQTPWLRCHGICYPRPFSSVILNVLFLDKNWDRTHFVTTAVSVIFSNVTIPSYYQYINSNCRNDLSCSQWKPGYLIYFISFNLWRLPFQSLNFRYLRLSLTKFLILFRVSKQSMSC